MTLSKLDKPNLVATMGGYLDIDQFCYEIAKRLILQLNVRAWYESPLNPMVDLFWHRSVQLSAYNDQMQGAEGAATFSDIADMFLEDE